MKSSFDVIVIGAGSVGTPITYFLAEHKLSVLCIESRPSAGQGQNKAAIGGMRATFSDPAKIRLCQKSIEIVSTWQDKFGQDIGWKQGGYCFPAYREKEEHTFKSILPIQKEFGLNINWHPASDIQEIVPGINPHELKGGTYSPEDGQVSPLMLMEAFEKQARLRGACFLYNEDVQELIIEDNVIKGVKTSKESFYAKAVVNAAGAWGQKIANMANINIPIIPDSHEAGITAPVQEFLKPLVVDLRPGLEGKTSNFYFGQNHENQIIFCYTPKTLFSGFDRRSTSEFMPVIANRLVDLIPRFKNLRIRRLWRGLYPMTPDGVAIVGKTPLCEGFYLAVGMCGQGFMMGPGVGYHLAKLIVDGKPELDQNVFDLLKPDRNFEMGKAETLK